MEGEQNVFNVEIKTLDTGEIIYGDVGGNGSIDVGDAILILCYIVVLISSFPVEG